MPRKNRITPFGEIVASEARGTLMGNRGCLHDNSGHVNKVWARRAWVTCLLDYNGRHRRIMSPGEYTELFFLDEATALSAGHRPCGTCQKDRYNQFKVLWLEVNGHLIKTTPGGIGDIDQILHTERCAIQERHERPTMALGELPDGCFIVRALKSDTAWLHWGGKLHEWSQHGYCEGHAGNPAEFLQVLTPMSIVRMLRDSFSPRVHASIDTRGTPVAKMDLEVESGLPTTALAPDSDSWVGLEAPVAEQKEPSITQLFRPATTPRGKTLFTYFAAVLRVTGMDQGSTYPLARILGNFSGHLTAGRIEAVKGGYRLTQSGIDYFNDRYRKGNPQYVDESEVKGYLQKITAGGPGWVGVD